MPSRSKRNRRERLHPRVGSAPVLEQKAAAATDSYSNAPARLGFGTPNLAEAGDYPLTRIGRDYMLLLSLYRSSWIIRKAIDCMAEDMLKDMPTLTSQVTPEEISSFESAVRKTGVQSGLLTALKWARLFGGSVALMVLKGDDDLMEPLDIDAIEPDSFCGVIPFDRWAGVQPDPRLITDLDNPREFGMPFSYTITSDASTVQVHHSRLLRFTGRELPAWERQVEQYWGLSEVELIFDELKKRDYASWNIVSLITRAQIMAIKDEQLSSAMSGMLGGGSAAFDQYLHRLSAISQSMNNQGLLVLPEKGELSSHQNSFGGLSDILNVHMLDICGACETPASRMYGRDINGLGNSGEGSLQTYYDTVEGKRHRELDPVMDKLLPVIAMSCWGQVPKDFGYLYPPVRTLTDKDRSELAKTNSEAVGSLYDRDLLTKKEARMELKQSSGNHGLGTNITDEAIAATPDKYASELGAADVATPDFEDGDDGDEKGDQRPGAAKDSIALSSVEAMLKHHGMSITIETPAGTMRHGYGWSHPMPADYGYIDGVIGADGDELDCYVGSNPESPVVFVVDQLTLDGKAFDEHKTMLGYLDMNTALRDYMAGHHMSSKTFGAIRQMTYGELDQWTTSGNLSEPLTRNLMSRI